jgi:hypothetical protein
MVMVQSSPSVIPFAGNGQQTAMFYSTTVQLGPDGLVDLPDAKSSRPYFGFRNGGTHSNYRIAFS